MSNIQIKAEEAELKGKYTNVLQINQTREEFILDFLTVYPPVGFLASRLITSPGHLKRIIEALQKALTSYEKQHGSVEVAEEPNSPIGFKTD